MYKVDISLPSCDKEECYCVSCIEKYNQENCNLLILLASEARDTLMVGKHVDLHRLASEWNKHETDYTDNIQDIYTSPAIEVLRNRGGPRNLSFKHEIARNVWMMENENGVEVVCKMFTNDCEVLIHYQLIAHLASNSLLKQLIPKIYGIREDMYYIEMIGGITIGNALPMMKENEALTTLAVIHGFLAYLHEELGFIHGDLSPVNIMLKGWDVERKEMYNVPLVVSKDEIRMVKLPFIPVIIDFGISSTWKWCNPWQYISPYRSELMDVKDLYLHYREDKISEGGLIHRVQTRLARVFGKKWREGPRLATHIPLVVEGLTHRDLLKLHLEEMDKHP